MATATNSTEGQILLSGDLTGTGESPQLRPTGATPGTYTTSFGAVDADAKIQTTMPSIVVDSKGRVNFIKNRTSNEQIALATSSTLGVVKVDGTTITSSGGVITATNITGLPAATPSTLGIARGDEATFYNSPTGIGILTANTSRAGKVSPDGTTMQMSGEVLSTVNNYCTASTLGTAHGGSLNGNIHVRSGGVLVVAPPVATTSTVGSVRPDNTSVTVDGSGILSAIIPVATSSILGTVRPDNTSVTVNGSGVLSSVLPTATDTIKGAVRPDNTTVTISGGAVLSATLPTATSSVLGMLRPDNTSVTINGSGVLTASIASSTATSSTLGIVRPDNSTMTISSGVLTANTTAPEATSSTLGRVSIVGTRLTSADGVLSVGGSDGTLVRPDNTTITFDGSNSLTLSSGVPRASTTNNYSATQFSTSKTATLTNGIDYYVSKSDNLYNFFGNNFSLISTTNNASILGLNETGGDLAGTQSTFILSKTSGLATPYLFNATKFKIEGGGLLSFGDAERLFFDMILIKKSGSTIGLIYNEQIIA